MTTARKLWFGFGTLTALLALSSVAILVRVRAIEGLAADMAAARNHSAAAQQLEINALGYALNVRTHLMTGDPAARRDADANAAKVDRELAAYAGLAADDRHRDLAARFGAAWRDLEAVGRRLLAADRRGHTPDDSARFYDLRRRAERLLDDEMQVEAVTAYDASKDAVAREVRTIVGFALTLLVVGVFIAVVTSWAVGRGVVAGVRDLSRSEARKTAMFEAALDCVVSMDHAGRVTEFNAAAERTFGHTRQDVLGKDLADLVIPPPYRGPHREGLARYMATGVGPVLNQRLELSALRADGSEFPVELTVTRVPADGPPVFTAYLRDITERKRAEDHLRQLAADLSEADRRKNEFLAMLAHELRNPLAPIRNAVAILKRGEAGTADAHAASPLNMMERQIGQMVRLVDDLLDVSRVSRGKIDLRRERVDLAAVVRQAVETSRPAVEAANHALTVTLPPHPVHLHADAVRLAQVFGNLLNNSCKYSEPGGQIWLTATLDRDDVVVTVTDTGVGIPADMLPTIFDIFTQVDRSLERSQSGLGIGLTLVQRLVEMHGGTVTAASDGPGRGSEFVVRLPLAGARGEGRGAGEDSNPAPSSSSPLAPRPSPLKILIVDDNQDSAESLALVLSLAGHETHTAFDGLAAVAAAERLRPDVVLCDIGMPKLNGYEVARRVRGQPWGRGMALVALTGWGQDDDRRKSREAGFDAHFVKPADHAALTKILAELPAPESRTPEDTR